MSFYLQSNFRRSYLSILDINGVQRCVAVGQSKPAIDQPKIIRRIRLLFCLADGTIVLPFY